MSSKQIDLALSRMSMQAFYSGSDKIVFSAKPPNEKATYDKNRSLDEIKQVLVIFDYKEISL